MSQVHGACACGRNRYVVDLPQDSLELVEVRFDTTNATRHHHSSPFTTWLRVPLDWYRSATIAFFADETAPSIKRSFQSPFATQTRRQFCGYCGTQLTSWNEHTDEDASFISLTLGSIFDEDLDLLEGLGLLSSNNEEIEEEPVETAQSAPVRQPISYEVKPRGTPGFETVVQDTKLGRMTRKRGSHSARDGSVKVEWEIVEIVDDDHSGSATPVKRKRTDAEQEGSDIVME